MYRFVTSDNLKSLLPNKVQRAVYTVDKEEVKVWSIEKEKQSTKIINVTIFTIYKLPLMKNI